MKDSAHKYKLCPNCDYFCNILEKNNFCPECGTELIDNCKICKRDITYPYSNYCPNCGSEYRKERSENNYKEI